MRQLHECIDVYRKAMAKGDIREAYQGLMEYIHGLRRHFKSRYPHYSVSGGIYYGFMDMTYFPIFTEPLRERGLKVAVVFIHETCRFEVWLAGCNKQVQATYWKLLRESGWDKYRVPPTTKGADSILEYTLAGSPDFGNLEGLTDQVEKGTVEFIEDVEGFLAGHQHRR